MLRGTLQPSSLEEEEEEEEGKPLPWWEEYYCGLGRAACLEEQCSAWRSLSSTDPARVSPGTVLSVLARDPRLTLPRKRDGIKETEHHRGKENNTKFS